MTSWMPLFINLTVSLGLVAIGLSLVVLAPRPQQPEHQRLTLKKH